MTPQLRRTLIYGGVAIVVLIVAGVGALVYRAQRSATIREVTLPADLVVPPQAPKPFGKPTGSAEKPAPQKQADVSRPPAIAKLPGDLMPTPSKKASATQEDNSEPSFDVVRVEPNGDSVVAGRAAPNSTVTLLSNGKAAATAKTDSAGQFVMTPDALKPGSHQLTLRDEDSSGHGRDSKQAVVVSVPKEPGDKLLVVSEEPGKPAKILSDGGPATASAGTGQETTASPPGSARSPSPPQTALASPGAITPAPPAGSALPVPGEPPAAEGGEASPPPVPGNAPHIGAVEAEAGHLFVQGTGQPGARLNIYLNNAPVAAATVGPDGRWTLTIRHGLSAGAYQVRVDQLGKDGRVLARAAAPFDYQPKLADVRPASPTTGAAAPSASTSTGTAPNQGSPGTAAVPGAAVSAAVEGAGPRAGSSGVTASSTAPSTASPGNAPSQAASAPPLLMPVTPGEAASGSAARSEPGGAGSNAATAARALAGGGGSETMSSGMTPSSGGNAVVPGSSSGSGVNAAPTGAPPQSASRATTPANAANPVVDRIGTVSIVKGDNLWTISRHTYGRGIRYTVIYAANENQIADPNLIYPGQIFVLPPAPPKVVPG